jgi:hypothetical protein
LSYFYKSLYIILYQKNLNRNLDRFPNDFMFQLTPDEYNSLRFQFGILKKGQHSKYLPYAFTEQGRGHALHDLRGSIVFDILQ